MSVVHVSFMQSLAGIRYGVQAGKHPIQHGVMLASVSFRAVESSMDVQVLVCELPDAPVKAVLIAAARRVAGERATFDR